MARPKEIIDSRLAAKAAKRLKKLENHRIYLRLLVISKAGDRPITELAQFSGVSRSTIARWIRRFSEHGVEGLRDRPKGHNPSKLNDEHRRQIAHWFTHCTNAQGEPVNWTLEKLRLAIQKEFGISISLMPLWRQVRRMDFRQKVPRPIHAKADRKAQEAFKKLLKQPRLFCPSRTARSSFLTKDGSD